MTCRRPVRCGCATSRRHSSFWSTWPRSWRRPVKSCSWMGRTTSLSIEGRVRLDEADGLWLRSVSSQAHNSLEIEPRRWLPGGPHTATAGDLIGLALAPPEELPSLLFNETDVARLVAAVEMD